MSNFDPVQYQEQQDKRTRESVCVAAMAKVVKFNHKKMTVDVQPLSKRLVRGKFQSQSQILDVPCADVRGGGFVTRPWYKPGDIGFIVFVDHDIDKVMRSGKEEDPNTERNHSPTDAFFVGCSCVGNQEMPGGIPDESIVTATEDGKQWFAVAKNKIQSQADKWEHKGDVDVTGAVKVTGDITITGDVGITGTVDVTGAISATGDITSATDVVGGGISLNSHTHTVSGEVTSGMGAGGSVSGDTGTPQ